MALPKKTKRALTPENTAEPILDEDSNAARVLRNLNFKVPPDFRKRFALRAVKDDVSQVELLKRALEAYERQQGAA